MSYWDWRERFLEAVDQELYPANWIDAQVLSGRYLMWHNQDAAILAELREYPSGVKEVHGVVAAGDVQAIKRLIPLAESWGRSMGARQAAISSVPAWQRIMRDAGYEHYQTTLVKDL